MSDNAAEYRRLAEEADQQAEAAKDPVAKRAYTKIADTYKELAKLIEAQQIRARPSD